MGPRAKATCVNAACNQPGNSLLQNKPASPVWADVHPKKKQAEQCNYKSDVSTISCSLSYTVSCCCLHSVYTDCIWRHNAPRALGSCRSSEVEQQNRETMRRGGKKEKHERKRQGGNVKIKGQQHVPYCVWNTGGMQTKDKAR